MGCSEPDRSESDWTSVAHESFPRTAVLSRAHNFRFCAPGCCHTVSVVRGVFDRTLKLVVATLSCRRDNLASAFDPETGAQRFQLTERECLVQDPIPCSGSALKRSSIFDRLRPIAFGIPRDHL